MDRRRFVALGLLALMQPVVKAEERPTQYLGEFAAMCRDFTAYVGRPPTHVYLDPTWIKAFEDWWGVVEGRTFQQYVVQQEGMCFGLHIHFSNSVGRLYPATPLELSCFDHRGQQVILYPKPGEWYK